MLPEPTADARAISSELTALIAAEIAAHGPMPFQRYMELALYAPGLGYYAAGSRKFGAAGDFVTAPELGSVFAEAIAETLAPTLRDCADPVLLELGAGSGALAIDLLKALAARDALPARYLILERSADLRERQQQRIAIQCPQYLARIEWLDQPPVQAFDGAIVANEVVDALSCARFVVRPEGLREIAVTLAQSRLVEIDSLPRSAVVTAFAQLSSQLDDALAPGYRSELVPELAAWFATISAPLRKGLVLMADYGYGRAEYYRPERVDGTLICHYRQHAHSDPYWYPGLNDISSSVDFTALVEAADAAGFELLGYDHQAGFLIGTDIERWYARMETGNERERLQLAGQIKRLMLPGEMGERFKVMLLGRGVTEDALPLRLLGPGQRRLL